MQSGRGIRWRDSGHGPPKQEGPEQQLLGALQAPRLSTVEGDTHIYDRVVSLLCKHECRTQASERLQHSSLNTA